MAGFRIPELPRLSSVTLAPADMMLVFDESEGLTKALPVGPAMAGVVASPIGPQGYVFTSNGVTGEWRTSGALSVTAQRKEIIATEGQTNFATSAAYVVDYLGVYLNGVRLANNDFTANDGYNVVIAAPCKAGDVVLLEGFLGSDTGSGDDFLRADLIETTGAGLVGYDPALIYPPNTVGHALANDFVKRVGDTMTGKLTIKNIGSLLALETTSPRGTGGSFLEWRDPAGRKGGAGYPSLTDDTMFVTNDMNAGIVFRTNAVEVARINQVGAVGIGTSSPAAKLSVAGATWPRIAITKDALATWFMGPAEPNNSWELRLNANPAIITATTGSRVGIGTTTPSSTLTVNASYGGNGDPSAALRINLNDSASGLYLSGYNGEAYVAHNAEYIAGTGWVARDTQASIHTLIQGYHLFYGAVGLTPGAAAVIPERMRITAAGDVGVGTTAPESRLHLQAPIWPRIGLTKAGVSNWYVGPVDPDNAFSLQLNTNNPFFRVNTTGDVGIGIGLAEPAAKLHVENTVGVGALRVAGNASANPGNVALIGITGVSNGYVLSKDAVNNVWHTWSIDGGESMRLHSNGYLGVGTQSPTRLIHARAAGANAIISAQCIQGDGVEVIMQSNVNADGRIGCASGHPLYLIAGGTPHWKLNTDGNIRQYASNYTLALPNYGGIGLNGVGNAANTGYIEFYNGPGGRCGYIGFIPTAGGSSTRYVNEVGGGHEFANSIHPPTAGGANVGAVSLPWGTVYANNNLIQPSDEREKDWIGAPDEAAIRAAGRIIDELGFYTWKTGSDTDTHIGVRAQQVLRILMEEGLEETQDIDFAPDAFITDPPVLRHSLIQFGTWQASESHSPPPPPTEEDPEPRAPDPTINPAGNRFCMNYAELGLFVATAQHARLNALEARLAAGGL